MLSFHQIDMAVGTNGTHRETETQVPKRGVYSTFHIYFHNSQKLLGNFA